jgi:hypothetical protein
MKASRMLKMVRQQGRRRDNTGDVLSGAYGATNKGHHVRARRQVGEAAGSPLRILLSRERSPGKARLGAPGLGG